MASSSGPWSPSGQTDRRTWPLGHAGQKRDNLQSSWDALLCSQLCSQLCSVLVYLEHRKKSSSNLNFLAKIHGNLHCSRRQPRQTPGASGMRHAAAVESCISQQSHGVPSPPSLFLSLLATELPQKRFLILIPKDSP